MSQSIQAMQATQAMQSSRWPRVLYWARRFLKDAQVPVRVELCKTEGVDDVEEVLPFRVCTLLASYDEDDEDDEDEDDEEEDDEDDDADDEEDDEDDEGADVVAVAFTLLNDAVNDTTLDPEKRGRAAVLQAVLDVFFIDQTKHQSASLTANRIAKVGKGEMAHTLLLGDLRPFGTERTAIACVVLMQALKQTQQQDEPSLSESNKTDTAQSMC